MKRLEQGIEANDAELAALTRAMQAASENGDGSRIAEVAQSIQACRQEIDRLFDALNHVTLDHQRLNAGFDGELSAL